MFGRKSVKENTFSFTFIGCDSILEFWDLLINKRTHIHHVKLPEDDTIHGAFTQAIGNFDAKFFNIPSWELKSIDPQQTISLTTAYEALIHAGYDISNIEGLNIGVFVGVCNNDARVLTQQSPKNPFATGFTPSLIANRISHILGLSGPSMTIDTSCSSSLSALHVACLSIRSGDCNVALVGGVNALLHPSMFSVYGGMGMLSLNGESRVFDVDANGFVRGEGCGFVVLKLVKNVEEPVLGIIRSTATNHNGHNTRRIVAPCSEKQEELLKKLLSKAKLSPNDITYVEAHGTGTKAGDHNELSAIKKVFGSKSNKTPVIIGSAKANIGHLEGGAGISGLIKAVLVLHHGIAPSNAGLVSLPDHLKIEETSNSAILINKDAMALDMTLSESPQSHDSHHVSCDTGLKAIVSSFGFGGVNVMAIVEAPSGSLGGLYKQKIKEPLQPSVLPGFYERFPMRLHVDHELAAGGSSMNKISSVSKEQQSDNTTMRDPCILEAPVSSDTVGEKLHKEYTSKYPIYSKYPVSTAVLSIVHAHVLSALIYHVCDDFKLSKNPVSVFSKTHIFDLGLDSLSVIHLGGFLNFEYGFKRNYAQLLELETLSEIANAVAKELVSNEESNRQIHVGMGKDENHKQDGEESEDICEENKEESIPRQESGYISLNTSKCGEESEDICERKEEEDIPRQELEYISSFDKAPLMDEDTAPLDLKPNVLFLLYEEIKEDIDMEELKEELLEIGNDNELTVDDIVSKNLFALGLDSISVVQLSGFIKKEYGITLTYTQLIELGTLQDINATIINQMMAQ